MESDQAGGERLRQRPVERFAGEEHVFDLAEEAARLRGEPHPAKDGHRQIVLFRDDPVSLVLFDFEAGGILRDHVANGIVTIFVLSGRAEISTPDGDHVIAAGSLLILRPGVTHDLAAPVATEVLVSIDLAADPEVGQAKMPAESDVQAAAAIRAHHGELHEGLRTRVVLAVDAARGHRPYRDARDAVLAFLDEELLPHAAAEETALYPAGETGAAELLVRAMRDEHRNLIAHVDELRKADDAIAAATTAGTILALFESHLAKENDLLVPALLADPAVSLATLLGGMHEVLG
jgi:quercetin dioxygenase-like cupin family protein